MEMQCHTLVLIKILFDLLVAAEIAHFYIHRLLHELIQMEKILF